MQEIIYVYVYDAVTCVSVALLACLSQDHHKTVHDLSLSSD